MPNESKELMIDMQHAELVFSENAGVFDLNLQLSKGSIMGMIGPSGCGKTTTVRLLNGVYKPQKGEVSVLACAPSQFTSAHRERIGYIPQQFVLYPNLSVMENLDFISSVYGMKPAERRKRMDTLLEFVELGEARHRLGGHLSGGMQRRLMLAGALMHSPTLIFADEPTAGIDPVLRQRFWDYFRQLRDQGHTLLVTTQYVGEAAHCDTVAVMRKGRIITVDDPDGLRRQALGGEMIVLEVDAKRSAEVINFLDRQENVNDAEPVRGNKKLVHVHVKNAAQELPVILEALHDHLDIVPEKAEPYLESFDEVFVKLMEKSEETTHD